ncbi:MAG: YlbF family regulator [Gemmatimonadota bacterium]
MAELTEKARDVGRALARTDEYQALRRAISRADEDREIVELRNKLRRVEDKLQASLRRGEEPDEELVEEYEGLAGDLQASPTYQNLVAAQANFDKLVKKVNQGISDALEEGAESRIIMPS